MIHHLKNSFLYSLLAAGLMLLPHQAFASCSKSLHIAYPDWRRAINTDTSATAQDEQLTGYGLDFELLKGILKIADCRFDTRPIPFKRIQEAIKHGQIDGTTGASLTVPRQKYAWFTSPYRREIIAMFMLTDEVRSFNPQVMGDLGRSNYRVGIGIGSWHGAKFEDLVASSPAFKSRILASDDFHMMFQWLIRGRANMAIMDLHHGNYLLKQAHLQSVIVPHSFYVNSSDVHIMLSKKSVSNEDAALISNAIEKFRGSEGYNEIMSRYVLSK